MSHSIPSNVFGVLLKKSTLSTFGTVVVLLLFLQDDNTTVVRIKDANTFFVLFKINICLLFQNAVFCFAGEF